MLFCAAGVALRQSGYRGSDPAVAEQIALESTVKHELVPGRLPNVEVNGVDVTETLFLKTINKQHPDLVICHC